MKAHLVSEDVVDVNQTVRYVAAALEPLAEENNIDLAVAELPGGARVRGDRPGSSAENRRTLLPSGSRDKPRERRYWIGARQRQKCREPASRRP